jgi:hypothetical protein
MDVIAVPMQWFLCNLGHLPPTQAESSILLDEPIVCSSSWSTVQDLTADIVLHQGWVGTLSTRTYSIYADHADKYTPLRRAPDRDLTQSPTRIVDDRLPVHSVLSHLVLDVIVRSHVATNQKSVPQVQGIIKWKRKLVED